MRFVGTLVVSFALATGVSAVHGLRDAGASTPPADAVSPGVTAPGSAGTPAPPSRQASREAMKQRLEVVLQKPALAKGRVGLKVVSLDTGEEIFAHNANELMNPASNVKLFTAAVTLARLGPEFRYRTDFLCSEPVVKGECKTLYIRGRGDPSLYTERIYGIAGEIEHRGIRKVGEIVVDDTYFDQEREGPGWEQEGPGDRPYMAPVGALSVNHNAVAVYVAPGDTVGAKGRIDVEPMSDYFVIQNGVKTVKARSRARLRPISTPAANPNRQLISVAGQLPVTRDTAVFYKKVDNPPMYAGETFKAIFKARGIAVKGRVRLGTVPVEAVKVFVHKSPALAEIVRELNKVSNNFVAEMLLKTVGAEMKGTPGTWETGVAATEEYLAELGIPKGSFVMRNGSGLNDTNRFSAAQLTTLLEAVAKKSTFFPEFSSSLGIAGRDGTIRSRMEGSFADGRLRGKTGTLENVKSLSGYVTMPSGETLIYAIMVNGISRRLHGPAMAVIDEMGIALASGGGTETLPDSGLAANGPPDIKARVATFASLAKAPNPDNLPFLRSAWRVESDPILRAVIADVIYRTDPDNGVTTLIDSVPTDGALFAKLRSIGQELQLTTPVVSPLIDVAAEGNPDALDKLIVLAKLTKDDTETSAALAEGFQEIGRTAPDELVEALQRAPVEISATAMALLGQGIAASEDKTAHPLFESLKTMSESEEADKKVTTALELADVLSKLLTEPRPATATTEPKVAPAAVKPAVNGSTPGGG